MKIQIIGTTAEGKTSIANLIFDLLKSHGFIVELTNEEEVGDYTPQLRSLKEKGIGIDIETIRANLSSFSATHMVIKTIDVGVLWPVGQLIQLKSGKWYDEANNWMYCDLFDSRIKEIQKNH